MAWESENWEFILTCYSSRINVLISKYNMYIYILTTSCINNTPWYIIFSIHEHNDLWWYAATGHEPIYLFSSKTLLYSSIEHYHSKFRPNIILKFDKQTNYEERKTQIAFYSFKTGQFALNKLSVGGHIVRLTIIRRSPWECCVYAPLSWRRWSYRGSRLSDSLRSGLHLFKYIKK